MERYCIYLQLCYVHNLSLYQYPGMGVAQVKVVDNYINKHFKRLDYNYIVVSSYTAYEY